MPFYVILEEPISGDDPERQVINCFRRCELKPILDSAGNVESSTTACSYIELSEASTKCPLDDPKISCERIQIMIATSGLQLFYNYIGILYKWAATTIGIVAVLIIVFSGIQISMSAGGEITEAKNRIVKSIVGLVILFLSGLILYTINPTFFV